MLRLKKYYKPYLKFILPAILFVLIVAWSDLQLPDYLSNIVNIGIQQKGIESGAPVVLSESTFQRIGELYPDEQAHLQQYYELVSPGSPESVSHTRRFFAMAAHDRRNSRNRVFCGSVIGRVKLLPVSHRRMMTLSRGLMVLGGGSVCM